MTELQSLRDHQRRERLAKVEALIAAAGSVRKAAKLEEMRRSNFQALRKTLRAQVMPDSSGILTPSEDPPIS